MQELRTGEVFVKFSRVKKACIGDGDELERALDDVFGIWVTVRSCCEKRIETKLCKSCSKCFGKELPPLLNFIQTKKKLALARKGLGTSLALQCYAGFVSSGFPSKIA